MLYILFSIVLFRILILAEGFIKNDEKIIFLL